MNLKGLFKKPLPRILGLDISSTAVKLLELSNAGGAHKVESYGVLALPEGAVVEGVVKQPEVVSDVIQRLVARCGTKTKNAAVAVSGSSVIIKRIQMPNHLTESDLELRILLDAEQHITFPIEEVALDFEILGPSQTEGQVDVQLVACRLDSVQMLKECIEGAGLTPQVVDVEVYALARAFEQVSPSLEIDDEAVVALFDIGASVTNITIAAHGSVGVPREFNFGGHQLTAEIMQRYGLSLDEAGQAKRLGGLPEDYAGEVLSPWIEDAVDQLHANLRNYLSASPFPSVDQVVFTGGGAAISGLSEAFERRTQTPAKVIDPFLGMNYAKNINERALKSDTQAMSIATGLAMWSFIDGKH